MKIDKKYMHIALQLAAKAEGLTSPNPMVGAVIVKGGRVIGKGFHKRCGLAHAEINALNDAGLKRLNGAVLYVTLEPCDHFGRTPPCTDAIIKSGIKSVVIGMKDPNPVNNGKGIRKLNKNGVKTSVGILEDEARMLNKAYIKFITKKMPYVTVKIAESLDGKIATRTGDSRWITSIDSRLFVHQLRGRVDAVMVGANTVIKDNPLLISKTSRLKQPIRVVVCGKRRIPPSSRIFSRTEISPVILADSRKGRVNLKKLLRSLASLDVAHVLVEGGGELIASLVKEKLVDQFLFFIAPKIIGGKDAVCSVGGKGIAKIAQAADLKNIKLKKFKKDIMIEAEVA